MADAVILGVISHDDGGFDRGFGVDTRNGGVRWCMFIGAGGVDSGHCGNLVNTNKWAFIAASYNQATGAASMMVNDYYYEYASGESLGPSVRTTTTIGRNPGFDSPFIGLIDNVFFFDEYLNEQALIDIRDNGIEVPEPPILALLALAALGLRMRQRRC